MKKLTLLLTLIILNCGSSKPIKTEKKEIKGKWLIESITNNNKTKLTNDSLLLNDVSMLCFNQSIWAFDPTTNSGSYNINDLYCSFGKRLFSYHSQEVNALSGYYEFTLIRTQKKKKKTTSRPFKIKLISISEMGMKWQCNMLLNNKATTININFKKVNKTNVTAI